MKTETVFGNGYEQVIQFGPEEEIEEWSVEFIPLKLSTALLLEAELNGTLSNPTTSYLGLTMPYESEKKYYSARNVNKLHVGSSMYQISCVFKREYFLE